MKTDVLESNYHRFVEDEKTNIEKINIPEEKKYFLGFISVNNVHFALHSIYVEQNYLKARNYFYKAAVSAEYMIKMHGWELQTGIQKICYALLSDNSKVIERYNSIKDKNPDATFVGYQFVTAIQSVLQNNTTELNMQIEALKISVNHKKNAGFQGIVQIFEGLKDKDKAKVENGLKEFVKNHKKREKIALVSDYLSIETAALAKLAYKVGLEVDIKSALVPKELLPVNEFENYDGYDFFNEL